MMDLSNDIILHVNKNGFQYVQFRVLLDYPEVVHMFTLKPLDFSTYVAYKENAKKAAEAESFVMDELGLNSLCRPIQTHKDVIAEVGLQDSGIFPDGLMDVDGLLTREKNLGLLLTYADCTPLLFYDPVKHVVANTHSGWKGTYQRIGYKTALKMINEAGCDPKDIICCIGPHIRKCSFEVDKDVADMFYQEFIDLTGMDEIISYDPEKNKYFIDTAEVNKQILIKAGLGESNIYDAGVCTVCDSEVCQSFRTDKALSGRAGAIIGLK